jgi:hypothetical protein
MNGNSYATFVTNFLIITIQNSNTAAVQNSDSDFLFRNGRQSTTAAMDVKFTAQVLNIPTISTPDIVYNVTTANKKTIHSFRVT